MCPAPAGMSPPAGLLSTISVDVPRASGDEPDYISNVQPNGEMCPAPAGMSPGRTSATTMQTNVPRASGDELFTQHWEMG